MSDDPKVTLTDGSPVTKESLEIDPATGMQKGYTVLSVEERQKGFVRPVRRTYKHVGVRPKYPLRNLTEEERVRYEQFGYEKYEEYPKSDSSIAGCYWTKERLNSGCGSTTTMGLALAETYARDPKFYSGTYCCHCGAHFPVGETGEFIWDDGSGSKVGT